MIFNKLEKLSNLKLIKLLELIKESLINHLNLQVKIFLFSLFLLMPWFNTHWSTRNYKDISWTPIWCWGSYNKNGWKILHLIANNNPLRNSCKRRHVYFPRSRPRSKMGSLRSSNSWCHHQNWYHGSRYRCNQNDHQSRN